jgi:hypothetical protein
MADLDSKLQEGELTFSDKIGVKGHQIEAVTSGIASTQIDECSTKEANGPPCPPTVDVVDASELD